jgi:hypothetical protein
MSEWAENVGWITIWPATTPAFEAFNEPRLNQVSPRSIRVNP